MAAIHETAYPRIKPNMSHHELKEIFTPSGEELALLNRKTKRTLPISRLGFMIVLKCYQYLGRMIKVQKIDPYIKKYIAERIGIDPLVDLNGYSKLTRNRHIKIIREYLNISTDKNERRKLMKSAALVAAKTKENLADIINVIIDELIRLQFELPPFKKLVRIARAARTVTNNNNYIEIYNKLSEEQKKLLDILLGIKEDDDKNHDHLSWFLLKQEAKKPTTNNIKHFINHVNRMRALQQKININLGFISPARIEQLRDEAMALDMADMKKLRLIKRYALATILIYMKTTSAVDDLVQIFITWIRKIEGQAKCKIEAYRLEQANKTDGFVLLLYKTLLALKNNDAEHDKIKAIEEHLGGKADDILEQCEEYLGLTGENHIIWMKKPYQNKRNVIFQLLENLTILSSSNDKSIESALKFIMHYRYSHKEWIELDQDDLSIQPDLSLLSDGWFKAVTGFKDAKGISIKKINRQYYEIAVFTVLMGDLPATMVAQRAGIARNTLRAIEQGEPSVTFSAYANVLFTLGLENDLRLIASDDELGRKLQDAGLPTKARAPRIMKRGSTKKKIYE